MHESEQPTGGVTRAEERSPIRSSGVLASARRVMAHPLETYMRFVFKTAERSLMKKLKQRATERSMHQTLPKESPEDKI